MERATAYQVAYAFAADLGNVAYDCKGFATYVADKRRPDNVEAETFAAMHADYVVKVRAEAREALR